MSAELSSVTSAMVVSFRRARISEKPISAAAREKLRLRYEALICKWLPPLLRRSVVRRKGSVSMSIKRVSGTGRNSGVAESSRTNADDCLPLDPRGRVECGDGVAEG